MTWHVQEGGLDTGRFVWLPSWSQCRDFLKSKEFSISMTDQDGVVHLEAKKGEKCFKTKGETDLEAMYQVVLETLGCSIG